MYWIILIAGLVGIDQWTKWYFLKNKELFNKFEVIKDFSILPIWKTGEQLLAYFRIFDGFYNNYHNCIGYNDRLLY